MDLATTVSGLWPWLAASLAGLVGFEVLRHWITKTIQGWRHRWIARRALLGEAHAEDLLIAQGYRILDRQVERDYLVQVDGHATRVIVRADLLVQDPKGGTLVAEVKTGTEAPRIENSATRRQLLEYRVAFDAPGVLLVDASSDTIRKVYFPIDSQKIGRTRLGKWVQTLVVGVLIGFVGAILVLHYY